MTGIYFLFYNRDFSEGKNIRSLAINYLLNSFHCYCQKLHSSPDSGECFRSRNDAPSYVRHGREWQRLTLVEHLPHAEDGAKSFTETSSLFLSTTPQCILLMTLTTGDRHA